MIIDTVIWDDSHSLLDMGWVKDSGLPLTRLELELLLWDHEKGSLSSLSNHCPISGLEDPQEEGHTGQAQHLRDTDSAISD